MTKFEPYEPWALDCTYQSLDRHQSIIDSYMILWCPLLGGYCLLAFRFSVMHVFIWFFILCSHRHEFIRFLNPHHWDSYYGMDYQGPPGPTVLNASTVTFGFADYPTILACHGLWLMGYGVWNARIVWEFCLTPFVIMKSGICFFSLTFVSHWSSISWSIVP